MRLAGPLALALAIALGPSVVPGPAMELAPAGEAAERGLADRGEAEPGVQSADTRVQRADPELDAEVRDLASRLRCPTCRALSVYDSPSEIAREMQDVIREQLRAGRTPEEVEAYFVERYGEWILLEPRASGLNWSVWLLPAVVLLGGVAFVLLTARRWVERGRAAAAALTEDEEL